MPNNAEYVVAAYGIVITVIALYAVGIHLKLAGLKSKLKTLSSRKTDAG